MSNQETYSGKTGFVYGANRNSPLFVHAASDELEKKNIQAAIEILENGIKVYPYFTPAYIILAKAYALSGNYKLSIDILKTGTDLMHSKKTYDFYAREIEGIRRNLNLYNPPSDKTAVKETKGYYKSPAEHGNETENLENLVREISTPGPAEIKKENKNESSPEGSIIVSETLAKIYISQGEIEEARKVYLKLIQKNPGREDYYRKKIEELPAGLQD